MKTKTITAELKVPFIDYFCDYHYIKDELISYQKAGFHKLKVKEIGFNSDYWAIFYIGKLPPKKEILAELKRKGFIGDIYHLD